MTTLRSIVAATDFSPASDAVVHRAAQLAATHRVSLCLLLAFDIGAWQILKGALCGVGPPPKVINAYVDSHAGALVVIGSRVEPALSGRSTTALMFVRRPPCAILIVRVADDRPCNKMLSVVNLCEDFVWTASLAVNLLPATHLHLLYSLDAASGSAGWGGLCGEPLRLMPESLHTQAEGGLQRFAQRLSTRCRRGRSWSPPRK